MLDILRMNKEASIVYRAVYIGITMGLMAVAGCGFTGDPRARSGHLPTYTSGINFPDPNHLGKHSYGLYFNTEVSGIVYTCKGGHIDIDHVRGNADNVRYLVKKVRKTLSKKGKGFTFNLTGEMSRHKVGFIYPSDWNQRHDKEKIIDEITYDTAAYLGFYATVWHEIQTWFGVHFAFIEPEFNSAFSWEDVYSNLIGVWLGVEAVKDTEHNFDKAVTMAIYRRLRELGVQPKRTAIAASDKVRGRWYTGGFVPDMKMRNFDIGLDGYLTPTLVPGLADCNDEPLKLAAPTLDTLKRYGFIMTYEIKPYVLEQGRIFSAAGSKRIFPEEHFPILIEYMKKDAIRRGYKYDE